MKKERVKQPVLIDNRYKTLKKLGSGAMGDVYKVRDLKDKRIIALKMLSKKRTSSEAVQRFKREFKLLAELHHPNLCSVYDFGILKDGKSYFTMEYIDGKDIFKASKDLSCKKIYPWIVQLCRVLEYIHSKGLIHYDIKPGNVLIAKGMEQRAESKKPYAQSPVPCVKLMDFGLAGEERIKGGTLIRGTFPYIAPEIIKGLAIDHRTDLYSLGVLLYGIFTKRSLHVKGKKSFVTLLEQQRERVFEPPSKIAKGVPKRLEQLIVSLLSFEPAARLSRANEVIKEINKFTRLKFKLETEKTLEAYLLSSRFVGREKEISLLKSLYEKMRQGEGKVILITGDAGIGKTRLLKEFRIFTQLQHSHSFTGYTHKEKTQTLESFYDIFSGLISYIGDRRDLFRTRELKLSLAVLFKIFPDLADGSLKKNLPKLVSLDPKQEKLRTFDALSELIRHTALDLGDMVILLEDLHWADDLSIQFLEYLGRNLASRNVLICGTSRKEELEENLVLKKAITSLKGEGCLSKIELKPLKFRSLYSFLDSTITSRANSSELVRYLLGKTGGNPFFVEEIMRTLLRKKGMSIGEKIRIGDLKRISIPDTIEDIVLRRIKDLDSNSQKILKFGVVLLKDFGYDLMKKLTGLEDTELSKALWELKSRQILFEKGNLYQFYHATLREVINKRLGYREKRELNYRVGKTLESINRGRLDKIVEDLAYYFINAKDHKRGVQYGLRAAKKSNSRYAYEQAIRFYEGVLDLLGKENPLVRFDVLLRLAQIKRIIGNSNEAIKYYNQALHLKKGVLNEEINIYRKIAIIYEAKGNIPKAIKIYDIITRHLRKIRSGRFKSILDALIEVKTCRAYQTLGDCEKVNKLNLKILDFPKRHIRSNKEIELLVGIYSTLGMIEYHKGEYGVADFDQALHYYEKAFMYCNKLKNTARIASTLTNIGICYYLKGDYSEASLYFRKSSQISEKIGYHYYTMHNIFNMGNVFIQYEDYLKAIDYFQKAFSVAQKIGNKLLLGQSLSSLGVCFLKLSHYKKAIDFFEKSLKIFDTLGWKYRKVFSLRNIGETYQLLGDYMLSLKFSKEALRVSKETKQQIGAACSFCNIGELFIEIGEFRKGRRFIEDALKLTDEIDAIDVKIRCNITLCLMYTVLKDIEKAKYYCEIGVNLSEKSNRKHYLHRLLMLNSDIHYHEQQYLQGIMIAERAIKTVKKIGRRDILAEALLMKVKNGIKQGVLSKTEVIKILNEAKTIAEEIGCPEVLWKVYFECGKSRQDDEEYYEALKYYRKCNKIFLDVVSKIKSESYRKSYLNHPDRQAVYAAKNEIKKLLN